jgi:UrcA family protein
LQLKKMMVFAAALALAAPVMALADEVHDPAPAVKVAYRGLDLSRPGDAAILAQRLETAALTACGASSFSDRQVREATRRSACFRTSMDRALAEVNAPSVSQYYYQHDRDGR